MGKQIIIGMFILKAEFLKLGIIDPFVTLLCSPRGRASKLSQSYPEKVVGDCIVCFNTFNDSSKF